MSDSSPKPNAAMFAKKGFEKIGEAATDAGKQLEKLAEVLPQNKEQGVKRPFVRRDHLTQRPFLNPDLINLRKGFDRHSAKIKKK